MEVGEERKYVVPLRGAKKASRQRRAPRAIRELKDFIVRHTKTENVLISKELNEKIWSRGIQKPPSRIKIRVVKEEEDLVHAFLSD